MRKPTPTVRKAVYSRIKARLQAVGKSEHSASLEAGLSSDAIRDIRRHPKGMPNLRTIEMLAPVLETSPGWLAFGEGPQEEFADDARKVPLVGYVGEGASAHYYAVAQSSLDYVPAPIGVTANTVALEIRGDCLGPLLDRWLAFYDDVRVLPTADLVDQLCFVGVIDGRVLVKRLHRGRGNAYDLRSHTNEGDVAGVEVLWAARVKLFAPGPGRKSVGRKLGRSADV